ncbi:4-alpha-glucanotransferase, chloroplastic/amyloplastic isoform X2 [Magnolia sinica]|uniref:4-alpha-glucanotransferase, chloroplastic/amyloplastic isoform X2 n=1 Tax=Magnolia sinica TaxID=86752 RepID=UPI002657CDF1|nr:4-alpha-glucanotransferase, chloroplastic/amyloplastic isoform X2 [Magnolia sinica]
MAISRSPSILSSSDQLLPLSFYNTFLTSRSRSRSINPNICSFSGSVRSLGLKSEARRRRRTFFEIDATFVENAIGVGDDLPGDYEWWFPKKDPIERRRAGVFLHPSSLPGPYGIGDLGREAFRFLDWLHEAGCSVWQVLPLVPPGRKSNEDGSPYSGQDANCGNTLLVSLEELVKDGLLTKEELPEPTDEEYVGFATVADIKDPLIAKAAKRLIGSQGELKMQLEDFCRDPEISGWLEDAAFFAAIDNGLNTLTWYEWPEPLKNRHLAALEDIYQSQKDFIDTFIAQQFLFQRQWQKVRNYAKMKGIKILGDMPIYVGYHSADVWANRGMFLLDRNGFPTLVSGVPPDAFSKTGQLWDSPLYDWKAMEKDRFAWWVQRIKRALNLYDEFRIDHFRGLAGFWAVPSESKVAMVGRWKAGPNKAFFDAILKAVGKINIIAEDLIVGWWENLPNEEKSTALKYLGMTKADDISWAMIQSAVSSVARTAIIPMQDILRLGSSARMNTPATQLGNWRWRMPSSRSCDKLGAEAREMKDLLSLYNRL